MKSFKKIYKKWRKYIFLGTLILLVAFFLRTYNLNSLPIFADEAIYIRWAQVMKAESTLRFLPLSDGKQPLFMWSTIPFLKFIRDPLVAGRFLSVLTGLGTLIGIFVASLLLFGSKKVALVSSIVYATSPFSVFFDRMALVDSMLAMFGVWTFIGSIITTKTLRLDAAMLTGFALGGALLTKSPGLFFALLLPTMGVIINWPKKNKLRVLHLVKVSFLWTVTLLIGYGIYNIQRLGPNFHLLSQRNKDYVYPLSHLLTSPLDPFLPFIDRIKEYFWILGPGFVLLFAFYGVFKGLKLKVKETLLVLVWVLIPLFIVSEFSKTMTARYALFSVPFVFILAGAMLLEKKAKVRRLINILLAGFLSLSIYLNFLIINSPERAYLPRSERSGYLEEWTAGYGIKESAEIIRQVYFDNPTQKRECPGYRAD